MRGVSVVGHESLAGRSSTIRSKLATGTTLLLAVISLFIYLYFPSRLEEQATGALRDKANAIAEMTAAAVSPALVFEDRQTIEEYLGAVGRNHDIVYAVVSDRSNRIVAALDRRQGAPKRFGAARADHLYSEDGTLLQAKRAILDEDQPIGHIYLGLSLQDLRAEVSASRQRIAFVSALIFLLGLIGVIVLGKLVTGPLAQIVRTAEHIAGGDLSRRASVSTQDEVGQLARSFNLMLDELESAQEELRVLNRSLERRVDERTADLQREVEERKRTEEALRASEERFRAMFDSAGVGIVLLGRDGRALGANPALCDMLGCAAEVLQDRNLIEFAHSEDRDTHQTLFQELVQGKRGQYKSETRYHRDDGALMWGNLTVSALPGTNGKPQFAIGMVEDITARKRLEQQLQEAQRQALQREKSERRRAEKEAEKLSHFPRMNPNPVVEITEDGRLTYLNEAAQGIVRDAGSADSTAILPSGIREIVEKCLLSGEKLAGVEAELGGRTLTWSFYPIVPDGIVYGYGFDITERLELEAQLRSVQRLEAAGRLAGGVAHDFNNIVMTITGLCEMLVDDLAEGDPMREDLKEIDKAADRAAALTRQLLAFSRKQMLQPMLLNLNDVTAEMQKMLRRLIGEDIELELNLDPDLGSVEADPGQIEQVIMNLAVNARDAMPRGGRFAISTANIDLREDRPESARLLKPGRYTLLTVSDTGMGMDEETKSRIFEPFFTTKEAGKGTGLGLATVYGIVRQSDGHIAVETSPGAGATFKIYLPRAEETAEQDRNPVVEGGLDQGSETILIVEDEDGVRSLARRILRKHGYRVLDARHGGEALLLCERHDGEIDLMLTDVVMPQMSGRELAERLAPLRPDMRVLFMTGYTDDAIIHHGVLDSDIDIIQKPFRPEALLRKIREVLKAEKLAAA